MRRLLVALLVGAMVGLPAVAGWGGGTRYAGADEGGGSASVGSTSDPEILFNDGGKLGGDPDFNWNKTTHTATAGGDGVKGTFKAECNDQGDDTSLDECAIATYDNDDPDNALSTNVSDGETALVAAGGEWCYGDEDDAVCKYLGPHIQSVVFTFRSMATGEDGQCVDFDTSGHYDDIQDNPGALDPCLSSKTDANFDTQPQTAIVCAAVNGCIAHSLSLWGYRAAGTDTSCEFDVLDNAVVVDTLTRVETTDGDGIPEEVDDGTGCVAANCFGDDDGVYVELNHKFDLGDLLQVRVDVGTLLLPTGGTPTCSAADHDLGVRGVLTWYEIPPKT